MGQPWERRGLLLPAPTSQPWARSHAALPCTEPADGEGVHLYYSPRDSVGRAHVARAELEVLDGELEVLAIEPEPVLSPGPLGAFDESGVTVSCVVEDGGASHLYYTGWTLGRTVPFYFYVGLAIRAAGEEHFLRVSEAPLLERDSSDPFLTASPWVLLDNGVWRMWYVSCVDWTLADGEPRHRYRIRYAESRDGVSWKRDGRVMIDFADDREYAISRPCVVRDDDRYRMWFAARGDAYCLGYAESPDGLTWTRAKGPVLAEPPAGDWDSEMMAYPAILDRGDYRYLLYNGNGYGETGIGYAVKRIGG
jgi:hypothetical protein